MAFPREAGVGGGGIALLALLAAEGALQTAANGQSLSSAITDALDRLANSATVDGQPLIVVGYDAIEQARQQRALWSREAASRSGVIARYYRGHGQSIDLLAKSYASYAGTVADVLDHHGRVVIPRVNRKAQRAIGLGTLGIALGKAADAALDVFRRRQGTKDKRQDAKIDNANTRARKAAKDATRADARAKLATGRATTAQKDATRALSRTRVAALAGTLAAVMVSKLGFRWWRCSRFRRFGRKLNCGHWGFLDELFFAPIIALSIFDACRLSSAIVSASEPAVDLVMRPVVGETDMICLAGGGTLPSAVTRAKYAGGWRPSAV